MKPRKLAHMWARDTTAWCFSICFETMHVWDPSNVTKSSVLAIAIIIEYWAHLSTLKHNSQWVNPCPCFWYLILWQVPECLASWFASCYLYHIEDRQISCCIQAMVQSKKRSDHLACLSAGSMHWWKEVSSGNWRWVICLGLMQSSSQRSLTGKYGQSGTRWSSFVKVREGQYFLVQAQARNDLLAVHLILAAGV